MTKEELEKEAEEKAGIYFDSLEVDNGDVSDTRFSNYDVYIAYKKGALDFAGPREKRIEELEQKLETERSSRIALVNKIAELERKYQELVDKLHNCWFCKKSCPLGKRLEAEISKCEDWELTFGISN